MAERARLLSERRSDVLACLPEAEAASRELLDQVLQLLSQRPEFDVSAGTVTRPDGAKIAIDRADPLFTLGHLVAEDLCILQKSGDAHNLTAALLCFPASWTLAEKIGKPLLAVHAPVASYDTMIASRVQRLFDGVKAGRPIWRANLLAYEDPTLYQPRRENAPRDRESAVVAYERSEKQVIWRLPRTDAVVFTIHTTVAPI